MSIREIFIEALSKTEPGERQAYLDSVCGDNPLLRAKVEALLQSQPEAGFLERPALVMDDSGATGLAPPLAEGPGTRIGRYKLLQQIGEGGFGIVFMAEQEEPVRRKVALK